MFHLSKFVAVFSVLFPFFLLGNNSMHEELIIRNIGHHVLLAMGDSTSLVLPVEEKNGEYHISFSADFAFEPSLLSQVVDSVFQASGLNKNYSVKVVECGKNAMVYGFEVAKNDTLLPCSGREYPKACYSIIITLQAEEQAIATVSKTQDWNIAFLLLGLLGGILLVVVWRKKKKKVAPQSLLKEELLTEIGSYAFDKKNMLLIYGETQEELTGKECELLSLLFAHKNETLDRNFILNQVWGDEGDYIGRTLDVFISKLRKKLESDATIRIINIRGVGYKLVLNEPELLT